MEMVFIKNVCFTSETVFLFLMITNMILSSLSCILLLFQDQYSFPMILRTLRRFVSNNPSKIGKAQYQKAVAYATSLAATITFMSTFVVAESNDVKDAKVVDTPSSSKKQNDDPFANFIPPNRSEPRSAADTSGPVVHAIGDTVLDIVLDPKMNAVLKVFSRDCYNCRNLGFVFEALAEEFQATPAPFPVVFAEFDGQENYTRGLIDSENEGKFPHVIAFQAGTKKVTEYQDILSMTGRFAQYHNPLLRDTVIATIQKRQQKDQSNTISSTKTSADDAEKVIQPTSAKPTYSRADIPALGTSMMMRWGAGKTIVDALLDFVAQNTLYVNTKDDAELSRAKEYVEGIRSRLNARLPELREKVLAAAQTEYMEPHDQVTCADPCGEHLENAYKSFYTATMGLSDPISSTIYMTDYRRCVWENEAKVKEYYMNIKKHIDFVEDCYKDKADWLEQDKQMREYYGPKS